MIHSNVVITLCWMKTIIQVVIKEKYAEAIPFICYKLHLTLKIILLH